GIPRPADTPVVQAPRAGAPASAAPVTAPPTIQRLKPTMQGVPRPADAPAPKAAPPTPPPAAASPPPPAATPPVVDQWLYVQNKIRLGPVTLAELKALVLAGKLLVSDMVFQTGWPRWKHAADVPELFPLTSAKDAEEEDDLEDELD